MISAVVTGASKGIGFETSIALAQSGDFECIVMIARKSDAFENAVNRVKEIAGNTHIHAIEADLSDPRVVDSIYNVMTHAGIKVDTIVNNAGFARPASINEATLGDFEMTMKVNLFTPFKFVQNAIVQGHPVKRIINIASTAGIGGKGGWITYSASKAALINMSEALREELAAYEIDVFCLSPGRCATDLRKTLAPLEDPSTIMQPSQVAAIIKLMTSEEGRLIKSQNIVVRT